MAESPVALITGAGGGIGRAIAIELALRRWRLVLIGRTESKLDETQSIIADRITEPIDFISTPVDLTDPGMPEAITEGVAEYWGRLDALVNNAAVSEVVPLRETTDAVLKRTFAVNTFAVCRLIACAWELFEKTKRDAPDARPCVVNISSMATADPFPGLGAYAASKAAVESLVRSIRNEGGDLDLRAFAIAPGAVETSMLRSIVSSDELPPDQTLDPRDVALEVVACIEGGRDDRDGDTILLPSP